MNATNARPIRSTPRATSTGATAAALAQQALLVVAFRSGRIGYETLTERVRDLWRGVGYSIEAAEQRVTEALRTAEAPAPVAPAPAGDHEHRLDGPRGCGACALLRRRARLSPHAAGAR